MSPSGVTRWFIHVVILLSMSEVKVYANTENPTLSRLYYHLLGGYNKNVRPVKNHTTITEVSVDCNFLQLIAVDVSKQSLTILLEMKQAFMKNYNKIIMPYSKQWEDELLTWDPAEYDGIQTVPLPAEEIWIPHFISMGRINGLSEPNVFFTPVDVHSNGSLSVRKYEQLTVGCGFNLTRYPTDNHKCEILYSAATGYKDKLKLKYLKCFELPQVLLISEFDVTSFNCKDIGLRFSDGPSFFVNIEIKRDPSFISLTYTTPLIILTIITCASFLLPPDSEAKLDILISIMLSYAVYTMILADNLPPVRSDSQPIIAVGLVNTLKVNAILIVSTCFILRMTDITSFAPPKYVFKSVEGLGMLVLLPYKGKFFICNSFVKVEETSKDQVNRIADSDLSDKVDVILTWLKSKDEEDDVRERWCYVAAVLDRILFLVSVAQCTAVYILIQQN